MESTSIGRFKVALFVVSGTFPFTFSTEVVVGVSPADLSSLLHAKQIAIMKHRVNPFMIIVF
jgi:hypothetical protein